jgi:hypothetical protein
MPSVRLTKAPVKEEGDQVWNHIMKVEQLKKEQSKEKDKCLRQALHSMYKL